jgi:hypothetical protein
MPSPTDHLQDAAQRLAELSQELLDAHCDTVCLAAEGRPTSIEWMAHVEYLKDLQRAGKRTLAQLHPA